MSLGENCTPACSTRTMAINVYIVYNHVRHVLFFSSSDDDDGYLYTVVLTSNNYLFFSDLEYIRGKHSIKTPIRYSKLKIFTITIEQ